MRPHMGNIARLTGSIHHQKQMITPVGHHNIIKDPASLIGKQRIALPPLCQPKNIHRHQPFQRARHIREDARLRAEEHLPHM